MSKQKILDRVAALLAKTEDRGATEEEAQAAIAKAQELLLKHGLDMDEVDLGGDEKKPEPTEDDVVKERVPFGKRKDGVEKKTMQEWQWRVLKVLANNFRCTMYFKTDWRTRKPYAMMLAGLPEDVAVCKQVAAFTFGAFERFWREYCDNRWFEMRDRGELDPMSRGERQQMTNAIKRDYSDGFVQGLEDVLKANVTEKSLIVVKPGAVVDWAKHNLGGRANVSQGWRSGDARAAAKGYSDGQASQRAGRMIER